MILLAVDAATEACSAALWRDGSISERHERIGRGHAARLLPMAHALLTEAGFALDAVDAIAFGRGPGGFTGLRIAAAVAQGLAAGAGLPAVPVSDLAALALAGRRASGLERVIACLDARMGQVYWAAFGPGEGQPEAMTRESLAAPTAVQAPGAGPWFGAGPGFAAYPQIGAGLGAALADVDATLLPCAADVAAIAAVELAAGRARDPAGAQPVYLRDEVAHRR